MSENEDELLDLMAVAKKQMAIVQAATQAMQTQRGELYDAIGQLKNMRAAVGAEAKLGVERGLSGITSQANTALSAEVEKARQTIGDVAEDLRVRAWGKSLQWVAGSVAFGVVLGVALSWFMWGRDARAAVARFDSINAALERQIDKQIQQTAPAAPVRPHKQQRSQDSAPAVPLEQP
jgi:hypothetical protein